MSEPVIEPVLTIVELPPGMLGPEPVTFEVRCFVVAGGDGVVLVDTATAESSGPIGKALTRIGLGWSDITDIVLTHDHDDHTGGLAALVDLVPSANVWAGAGDIASIAQHARANVRPAEDGQQIGELRVVATPGHTRGHISLMHVDAACLLIGDLVGSVDGAPTFGPPAFTQDPAANIVSLRRVLELDPQRILFSHGAELAGGTRTLHGWLDGASRSRDIPAR